MWLEYEPKERFELGDIDSGGGDREQQGNTGIFGWWRGMCKGRERGGAKLSLSERSIAVLRIIIRTQ